ncbi:MAG: S26 family signal peptidase [Nitrososphaeraceae archaeon]|nr:S26 family signal peptidase [Nitrososphaeraceae archaeon]
MKNKIKLLVVVVCIVVIIAIGFRFAFGDYINPFYVVARGSMMPTLNIRDLVIVNHDNSSSSFNNLKIGDIIVFKKP